MLDGVEYQHVALAINRNVNSEHTLDGVGFLFTRLGVGDIEGRSKTGVKTTSYNSQSTAYGVGTSYKLSSKMRLGVSAKAIQMEIGGYKSNLAMAADFSLNRELEVFSRKAVWGLGINNLGQKIGFIDDKDPLPAHLNTGFSINLGRLLLMSSISQGIYDPRSTVAVGVEPYFGPLILMRLLKTMDQVGSISILELSYVCYC
jgi:hypothetical protein